MQNNPESSLLQQSNSPAYLIIRQGSRWNDVFRLHPNRQLVIGRASSNQIVVADERCSRHHAEITHHPNGWVVRDLGSRNGTIVNSDVISGEHVLKDGDVIQVSFCVMTFVHSLATAFRSGASRPAVDQKSDQQTMEHPEPHTITHRARQARWLKSNEDEKSHQDETTLSGGLRTAKELFRLAYDISREESAESAAQLALDRLLTVIGGTAGGILRIGKDERRKASTSNLVLLATHEREGKAYHRVSDFLTAAVLKDGQALLARNIQEDSQIIDPAASASRMTTSVICAPIRIEDSIVGFIHLYSSDDEKMLGPDDLEIAITVADTLSMAWQNLRTKQKLTLRLQESQRQIRNLRDQIEGHVTLIGNSPALLKVQQQVARVGPTQSTVLIRGESGVGKELVARAIHLSSPRRQGPFIAINCAALSAMLLESEIFGHEKGAFTGATERKIGRFEMANGGTLMLDEIGEMSAEIQSKFLRALENRTFERLGGTKSISADVRVLAATNRDLETAVREGQFRADLYFRLRVIEITVPPLRERREDIIDLAEHFRQHYCEETGYGPSGFSERAKQAMREYQWPGNIRELKNAVERAVVLSSGELAEPEDLALSNLTMPGQPSTSTFVYRERSLEELEREHILATLEATGGHKSKTATILGIERSTLDRKLKKYEIDAGSDE